MSSTKTMDPFSSKDILKTSEIVTSLEDAWHSFRLEADLQSDTLSLAEIEHVKLPRLTPSVLQLALDDAALEPIDTTDSTSASIQGERDEAAGFVSCSDEDEDIWDLVVAPQTTPSHGLLSWDQSYGHDRGQPAVQYLTEVTATAYDTIVSQIWHAQHGKDLQFARPDQFHWALVNLILGRSSIFFVWDENKSMFEARIPDFAASGLTANFTSTLCHLFCAFGSSIRNLRLFCQSTKRSNPTLYAVQSSMMRVLHTLERHVLSQTTQPFTILYLKELIDTYLELTVALEQIVHAVNMSNVELQLLTNVVRAIDDLWISAMHLRPVLSLLAASVLQPAIHSTSGRLGLCTHSAHTFGTEDWLLGLLLPTRSDDFVETTECILVALEHAPQAMRNHGTVTPIRLVHDWHGCTKALSIADQIEQQRQSSLQFSEPLLPESTYTTQASSSSNDPFTVDFSLETAHSTTVSEHDADVAVLENVVHAFLQRDHTEPGWDLSPLQALQISVVPFLEVQQRTSSYSLLNILFLEEDLLAHLHQLHSFQLLGDGLFATRLSKALFDVNRDSAEGHRNIGLTAGLRLEDREAWPPASSELRVVLMGLLSGQSTDNTDSAALGRFSFAIRDLSESELEACRDVSSTHALDFLRLVYAPPNTVLELIISAPALEKYDRIFRLLLILMRLHALSQSIIAKIVCRQAWNRPQESYHKFCLNLHHLTTQVLDYALNVAIEIPWAHFMKQVKRISSGLIEDNYQQTIELAGSVARIRELHESALDEMLRALLLKTKQTREHNELLRLFELGLQFASTMTAEAIGDQIATAYQDFDKKKRSWTSLLRQTSQNSQDPALQRLEYLLVKLDVYHE